MKKIIDPGREPVVEYYCDGCNSILLSEPDHLEPSVQLIGNFGYGSGYDGYIFNHTYCHICGIKAAEAVESTLRIKIKAGDNIPFAFETEEGVTQNGEEPKADQEIQEEILHIDEW